MFFHDRSVGFGQKAADADLWGIPTRIIVSDKTIERGGYEIKERNSTESELIVMI